MLLMDDLSSYVVLRLVNAKSFSLLVGFEAMLSAMWE